MNILQKLQQIFSSNETEEPGEELVLKPKEAVEMVEKTSEEKLQKIEDREQHLISETDRLLDGLRDNLGKVDEYEDIDGIKAAEDIAESFYNSRKIMIENFNPEENSESYQEELQKFLEEFNDVDRKEKALMDRMKSDVAGIAQNVQNLDEALADLDEFNNNALNYRKDVEKLRNQYSQLEELQNKKEDAEEKLEKTEDELEQLADEVNEVEETIQDLEQGEEWKKREELEKEIEQLNSDRKQIEKRLSSAVSNLDRGLKKLIYQIENRGLEFDGSKANLVNLRDENFTELERMNDDLKLAEKKIEKDEILTGRQLDDFKDQVSEEISFVSEAKDMTELNQEIQGLREEIDNFEVVEKKSGLEERIEKLENKRDKLKDQLEAYRRSKEDSYEKIEGKKEEIGRQAQKLLQKKVKIK
ncbi:MAG: chromosome segregation ATPase [Colwellia polaris]|jgi:chromosome segregation ATPase